MNSLEHIKPDTSQPMTSLLPRKKKVLDPSNLSIIKDDESNQSKQSRLTNNQYDTSGSLTTSQNQQYTSRLQQVALAQPKASKLLLARQQSKLKIDTAGAKQGVPMHQQTLDLNSQSRGGNQQSSMSSASKADDRLQFQTETNIKKTKEYLGLTQKLINLCDDLGKTPLHFAAFKDNIQLVRLLLERGAIPIMRDHK